jgi:hypothetical protein
MASTWVVQVMRAPNETTPAGETPPSSLELGELLSCGAL